MAQEARDSERQRQLTEEEQLSERMDDHQHHSNPVDRMITALSNYDNDQGGADHSAASTTGSMVIEYLFFSVLR